MIVYGFFEKINSLWDGNRIFIRGLKKVNRNIFITLISLVAVSFFWLMIELPYAYDEAYSFNNFSAKGIFETVCNYPLPNNHVFFNVVSAIFLHLPFNEIIATRLPSFFCALISTYYFFKLCCKLFSGSLSLIITTLFIFSYPVIFYSVSARGYGMMILFFLLCLYSCICIFHKGSLSKYMGLFAISAVLGFYTITSFLLCLAPLSFGIGVYLVVNERLKGFKAFLISHFIIVAGTFLLYAPIIHFSGLKALTEAPFIVKRDFPYLKEHIISHLQSTFSWLLGFNISMFWMLALLPVLLFISLKNFKHKRYFDSFILLVLLSPIPLIFQQKVIPYERNWCFMVVPLALAIGSIINEGSMNIARKRLPVSTIFAKIIVPLFVLLIAIVCFANTLSIRHQPPDAELSYKYREFGKALTNKTNRINSIRYFNTDYNFIVAEYLKFEVYRKNREKNIEALGIGANEIPQCDLLILDTANRGGFVLKEYSLLKNDSSYCKVYIKRNL